MNTAKLLTLDNLSKLDCTRLIVTLRYEYHKQLTTVIMKKTFILALLTVLCSVGASAQHYRNSRYYNSRTDRLDYTHNSNGGYIINPPRNRFGYVGLRIGPAFSTVSSDDPALNGGQMRTGLNVGVVGGLPLSYRVPLFFEGGLFYTQKGGKNKNNYSLTGDKMTYDLNYLEVPLTLKYIHNISRNFSVQPYVSGYLALGIAGQIRNYGERQSYSSFGKECYDCPNFQRFDGGLKFGVGIGLDLFYADVSYELGLANISHDTFDRSHTGSLMLNAGVNF